MLDIFFGCLMHCKLWLPEETVWNRAWIFLLRIHHSKSDYSYNWEMHNVYINSIKKQLIYERGNEEIVLCLFNTSWVPPSIKRASERAREKRHKKPLSDQGDTWHAFWKRASGKMRNLSLTNGVAFRSLHDAEIRLIRCFHTGEWENFWIYGKVGVVFKRPDRFPPNTCDSTASVAQWARLWRRE